MVATMTTSLNREAWDAQGMPFYKPRVGADCSRCET